MGKLQKEAIRIITLWRSHGPDTSRIDLEKVFNEIVIPSSNGDICKIVYERFESFEGMMARIDGLASWRIGVNTNIGYVPRRNFTLAHEIGHFIGHRYLRDDFKCTFDNLNDFDTVGLELEANEFASGLLMPADVVRQFDKDFVFCHAATTELASKFGVSRAAAAYRWLKLTDRHIGFMISRDGMINSGRASERLFSKGVFFRQGSDVPSNSLIHRLGPGDNLNETLPDGIWSQSLPCHESSYATTRNGYVYTYLDFDRR